jgi:hypothetical protein
MISFIKRRSHFNPRQSSHGPFDPTIDGDPIEWKFSLKRKMIDCQCAFTTYGYRYARLIYHC